MNFAQITQSQFAAYPFLIVISNFICCIFHTERSIHQLDIIQNNFAAIMKKEHVTAGKKTKTETIMWPKMLSILVKNYKFPCSFKGGSGESKSINIHKYHQKSLNTAYSSSQRDNRPLHIHTKYKNLHIKCINPKPNFNNDISGIICD